MKMYGEKKEDNQKGNENKGGSVVPSVPLANKVVETPESNVPGTTVIPSKEFRMVSDWFDKQLETLELFKDGALVIKVNNDELNDKSFQQFAGLLRKVLDGKGYTNTPIIVMSNKMDISTLSEKMMYEAGWFGVEKLKKIFVANGLDTKLLDIN